MSSQNPTETLQLKGSNETALLEFLKKKKNKLKLFVSFTTIEKQNYDLLSLIYFYLGFTCLVDQYTSCVIP